MDDSNSSPEPSFYGNPDTTQVLQVIWHNPENQKFLEYVRERQEAFEQGAEALRVISNDLKVLITQFENSVLNNSPLGQVKRMSLSLIDMTSAEVMELLQCSADRPTAQPDTDMPAESKQQQMAIIEESFYDGQPEWDEVIDNEQKLDDEWEPVVPRTKNIVPANLVKQKHALQIDTEVELLDAQHVVSCVSEVVGTIIVGPESDGEVAPKDAIEEEEVLTGEEVFDEAVYDPTQTVIVVPEAVDLENEEVVPSIDHQQELVTEVGGTPLNYDDILVGAPGQQVQDSIQDVFQSTTTNASTKYDDLLVIPPEEFYQRVPWMHYIVSEVKWNRRWCSMSDLDALKNKKEKEAAQKAEEEEQARIAEEQRISIAKRIKARAETRNRLFMLLKVDTFFAGPLIHVKDPSSLPPALNEIREFILRECKSEGGGAMPFVGNWLYKRREASIAQETKDFYYQLFKLKLTNTNSSNIDYFVKYVHNEWKTGKTFKSKENAFLKELKQWVEFIWTMERSEYLADRRRGASPTWTLESSYSKYLNIDCPKYYDTGFFKARMQFHLLNDNNDPISDFLGLHYTLLDEQQVNDVILDRDFFFIANECAPLKDGLMLVEKAFFMEQLNVTD